MRKLELDFRRRPRPALGGWVLLGCGLLAAAGTLLAERRIAAETASFHAALRRIERALPAGAGPSSATAAKAREALPAADLARVQAQLNLPWGELFGVLEAAADGDVALLSLAPDARKGELRIAGEARDLAAMLAFHRKLEDSAPLRDVSLLNHEIAERAPGRPVRFSLVAAWTIDGANP